MNVFTCSSFARGVSDTGVIHVSANPELPLRRHVSGVLIHAITTMPA